MKKIFSLLMIMLCFSTIKAIETDSIISGVKEKVSESVSYVDTSSTFKMLYSDIKTGITALAAGLKVGTEHVYGVLVKQQIANSVVYLILGLIAIYMLFNFINKHNSSEKWIDDYDFPTIVGALRILQVVLALVFALVTICHLDDIVMGFVNPEYGAIKEIISFIK